MLKMKYLDLLKTAGEEDKKIMEELKEREKQLKEDVSKTPEQKLMS